MFKTPTHQSWVQQNIPYRMMNILGLYPGMFIPDPRVSFEAACLMRDGGAEELRSSWSGRGSSTTRSLISRALWSR